MYKLEFPDLATDIKRERNKDMVTCGYPKDKQI